MDNKYYLYRHIRLDKNEPFYIGIGTGRRYKYKQGRNKIWNSIVIKNDGIFEYEILLANLTKEEAFLKEKEFIKLYGRKDLNTGCLANLTDGGDGANNMCLEARMKISKANTGKKRTEEFRKQRSLVRKGKKHTIETKIKISESQKGAKNHMYGKIFSKEEKLNCSKRTFGDKNPNYKGDIIMLDKVTHSPLFIFKTVSEIKEFLNRKSSNLSEIYANISGRKESAYGYKWIRSNKLDKADLIANYYKNFKDALKD